MSNISDVQVDQLLREAELRLRTVTPPATLTSRGSRTESHQNPEPRDHVAINTTLPKKFQVEDGGGIAVRRPELSSARKAGQKDTAGTDWFDLPKTKLTPEFKRDWQLLRMRGLLDPKHQKKSMRTTAPEYSQIGEIIAGPTEFYSGRLTRKERKTTLLEEVMADHNASKLKSKYAGIQRNKSSGKKLFYQRVVSQRRHKQGH